MTGGISCWPRTYDHSLKSLTSLITALQATKMPPFSSAYEVTIPSPLERTFSELSSQAAFEGFIKLSPTTHTIETLGVEHPTLSSKYLDQILEDGKNKASRTTFSIYSKKDAEGPISHGSSAIGDEKATRYRFKLVERIPMLGGLYKQDVEIFGSQIVVEGRHLHLYETTTNGGLVEVLKIRRFEAAGNSTKVIEQIRGETNWMLRKYTEVSCRKAHVDHMNRYQELLKPGPA